jgi:predicted Rossmann fold flavoprotein
MPEKLDVVVLGGGGAGLFCAATAAKLGKKVVVLDHADKLGKKILISGGGRCNFTNIGARPETYKSENEHFCKSALSRFTPSDFVALVQKHGVPYYEKKLGQLFCVDSAQRIVDLLEAECAEAGAEIRLGTEIQKVSPAEEGGGRYKITTNRGELLAHSVVVATGGLSIPKIGATDLGYRIAKQFSLKVTELAPALVNLTMPPDFLSRFGAISGVSVDALLSVRGKKFRENVLFTHTGISGPAVLQASLHWFPGDAVVLDLSPDLRLDDYLLAQKKAGSRKEIKTLLGERLTDRLAEALCGALKAPTGPVCEKPDQVVREFGRHLHQWELKPSGTGGYGKAEVTRGGVSTEELSSKTLESKKCPGLFFIGELVDVTGWLGGYNFQWAWASGAAAGANV